MQRILKTNFNLIDRANEKFAKIIKMTIYLLTVLSLLCLLLILFSYCAAHYYWMAAIVFISFLVVVMTFFSSLKRKMPHKILRFMLVYLPLFIVLINDLFFLHQKNESVPAIFLHTHFILLVFVAISGLITDYKHVIIVGCVSIVWIWIFTIISGDSFLWLMLLMDTALFVTISTLMYFFNISIHSLVQEVDDSSKVISKQNEELSNMLDFKVRMFNLLVHDIKNPINRIMFASNHEVINKEDVVVPSMHILQIVEDLLDLYKLKETKMPVRMSVVHLNSVIQKAIEQTQYLLNEKKLNLHFTSNARMVIMADAKLLERVVINILTNAIKYSNPNGAIEIYVHYLKNKVRVEIVDHGVGIPSEHVDFVFDSYHQVNSHDFAYTRSTGLGLSFCKQAIHSHRGTIGAISEESVGTTIWFELPDVLKSENVEDSATVSCKVEIDISPKEVELMQYLKSELSKLAVYQTSQILNVKGFTDVEASSSLEHWKNEVLNASLTGNEEYFRILLK